MGLSEAAAGFLRVQSEPGAPAGQPVAAPGDGLLVVRGLDVAFGAQAVLHAVDLTVGAGEVVAVLGTNGAGKTTLLRTIAGLTPARGGTIEYGGEPVHHLRTADRVGRGIVMVPGGAATFPHLSVIDNLMMGCHGFAWERDRVRARIDGALTLFPRLGERWEQRAGSLSGGEQQMLAIAKALLPQPALLLVDEMSLGLAPVAVRDLVAALSRLRDAGTTMVIVEQSVEVAAALAGRAVWLEKGRVRFAGAMADLPYRADLSVFLEG